MDYVFSILRTLHRMLEILAVPLLFLFLIQANYLLWYLLHG